MAWVGQSFIDRVGRAIAERRRALGLTQAALAARLSNDERLVSDKNVQRVEAGDQNLTLDMVFQYAMALRTTPEALTSLPVEPASELEEIGLLRTAGFQVRAATAAGRRASNIVKLTTLRAIAGRAEGETRDVEAVAWVTLNRSRPVPEGQFIARVSGQSMEPRVLDGAFCLFGPPGPRPYGDRLLLVAGREIAEQGQEGPVSLKRMESHTLRDGRTRVTLRSINPEHEDIVIETATPEQDVRVIAELVEVLTPND